jgi:hypothetical protein
VFERSTMIFQARVLQLHTNTISFGIFKRNARRRCTL